jgi:hypothetical protein
MALGLSACVSPYVAKPYDRAAAGVQSIAVVDDSAPDKAMAYEVASLGSNFGLIGALVDAGIQQSRTDAMNAVLAKAGFDAEAKMEARLVSAVGAHGYTVRSLTGEPRSKRVFLTAYPVGTEGVDAYLDVVVTSYGYISAGAGQPFRPTCEATVRLVSAKDSSKVLMENIIVYNPMMPRKGVITLTPSPEYAFNNRGELLADPSRLAAGMEDAVNQVADTAAKLLL